MINSICIIPTGNEIFEGVVIDTNSVGIINHILEKFPKMQISRETPVIDKQEEIVNKIKYSIARKADLIIIIGGSGGGHKFDKSLSKDFTHTAMTEFLDELHTKEIYGKNGHLWSKLIVGKKENVIVLNVPGPYDEAMAAAVALVECLEKNSGLETISESIYQAVLDNYPRIESKNE